MECVVTLDLPYSDKKTYEEDSWGQDLPSRMPSRQHHAKSLRG